MSINIDKTLLREAQTHLYFIAALIRMPYSTTNGVHIGATNNTSFDIIAAGAVHGLPADSPYTVSSRRVRLLGWVQTEVSGTSTFEFHAEHTTAGTTTLLETVTTTSTSWVPLRDLTAWVSLTTSGYSYWFKAKNSVGGSSKALMEAPTVLYETS